MRDLSRCYSATEGGKTRVIQVYARGHMTVLPNWDTGCNHQNHELPGQNPILKRCPDLDRLLSTHHTLLKCADCRMASSSRPSSSAGSSKLLNDYVRAENLLRDWVKIELVLRSNSATL